MIAPRDDSYAWNYKELATLLTLSESLAERGFKPLTIGSMRKNATTESYPDIMLECTAYCKVDESSTFLNVVKFYLPLLICAFLIS